MIRHRRDDDDDGSDDDDDDDDDDDADDAGGWRPASDAYSYLMDRYASASFPYSVYIYIDIYV